MVWGALALGALLRLQLVREYHVSAVDGLQYRSLSQELLRSGRFAFGPPPAPLAFTRLPGYPLFLAAVAVHRFPADLETHLACATRANALLDLGTALLVFLILRERCFAWATALGALAAVLLSPLLFMLASHALTESLATFLATLELYLALRAGRTGSLAQAALAGLAAGCAQLVRADALTMAPAVILALLLGRTSRRLAGVAVFCGVAAMVFAPWPLRNLVRFGSPYPAAWPWRTAYDGRPLPTGPLAWARTWATGAEGEGFLDLLFAFERPLDAGNPGVLRRAMHDTSAERDRLVALFARYNRERLSPNVDAELRRLAAERARRAPFRTYLLLPLGRMVGMYAPVPDYEIAMESRLLGLPRLRPAVRYWDFGVYALAFVGLVALLRPGAAIEERHTGMVFGAAVVLRSLVEPVLVPLALTQRMLAEVYPVLLMLAACGTCALADRLRRGRRASARHPADVRCATLAGGGGQ